MREISKSIYKTLFYQAIFECSPRIEDFVKAFISSEPFPEKLIRKEINLLEDVSIKKGHVCLNKRSFVQSSIKKVSYSEEKMKIAIRYAKILSRIPWYRMIAVSGSLASYNARKNDDIDLFVIVAPQRLWMARLSDWVILNFLKVRRNANSMTLDNKICINYYLSENSLELKNQDIYVANEIARLIPLYGELVYREFVMSNSWINHYLSNFGEYFDRKFPLKVDYQVPFRFVLLDLFENVLGKLQCSYMKGKRTKEIITESEIRFHPKDVRTCVVRQYKQLIKSL